MRKITAITQVTLDGVMQSPGGPDEDPTGGFTQGGWAMPYFGDALGDAVLDDIMSGEFDLLLGRRTYEIFAAYWPYAGDNAIATAFNKAAKYVVTNSLERFDWANTHAVSGDAVDGIRRLKASDGRELHAWGSSELLQTLIAADLVDEFRIWTFPLVLGAGKRLFEHGTPARAFELADTKTSSKGVMFNTYRPAGPVRPGSFAPDTPSGAELARRKKLATEDNGA